MKKFSEKIFKDLKAMQKETEAMKDEHKALYEKLEAMSRQGEKSDKYVISYGGEGSFHLTAPYQGMANDLWITKCTWRYGRSSFRRSSEIPEDTCHLKICKRCLPAVWEAHYKKFDG